MKTIQHRIFDPAILFLNRYSFPRKFAIAGTLVVLPLLFVTFHHVATLNERITLSEQALGGNQAVRLLIPLWRLLCDHRLEVVAARSRGELLPEHAEELLSRIQEQLQTIAAADRQLNILHRSSRWVSCRMKLEILLKLTGDQADKLAQPELLDEITGDVLTSMRHAGDVSRLSIDPHMDSQNLAVCVTRQLPSLIDVQDQLREQIAVAGNPTTTSRLELQLAESNGSLQVLGDSIRQRLSLSMHQNHDVAIRLRGPLSTGQASLDRVESGLRMWNERFDDAPSLGEIDAAIVTSTRESLGLLSSSQDTFDEVVEARISYDRLWRLSLLAAVLAPLSLAAYLMAGLCLAIVKTADQMREVTDDLLSNNTCHHVKFTVDACDELSDMIAHFGRLAVRLREELTLANAEAARASTAEESLRVNQERFNLVLQGANDGIWDWDLQTDRVFYSNRFKELLGYEKGEFDVWLSALADVLHPDDFDMTWRAIERHFQDREPYHIEHRLKTKSGEYRWYLERGQAVWDQNGVPIRMAGSIKDITQRKSTEARDRVRTRVLELLAAGADLSDVLDPLVGSVESENSRLRCSILFLDKDGKRLFNGVSPTLPDYFNSAIEGLEVGIGMGACGTAASLGQRVIVEDISAHPYWERFRELAERAEIASCWSEPIRGMSGKILGTLAIYGTDVGAPCEADITLIEVAANLAGIAIERKQVDAALSESEERWKFALEGAGDAVWDWNIQSGRVVFSRRWSEMLGLDEHLLEGTLEEWRSRILPEDLQRVMASMQDYLDGKSISYTNEHRMVCSDNSVKWILSRGMIVSCDSSGAALRMIGTHSDITDRKRMEEDMRRYLQQVEASRDRITDQSIQLIRQSEELAKAKDQAEAAARAKSEFLANMSHELRTPLTAILGYADLLYDEGSQGGVHRETVEIIHSNGRHLQELIDDILDFSKIEANRMTLDRSPVSPRQLVEDVLRLMRLRAREKGLTLDAEFCLPLPDRIMIDALRVRQILVNLLGNAIKFTGQGSIKVAVRYDATIQQQTITVTDTGIGIEQDHLHRLFAPFSQADSSMTRRFGGTGLGLSISKHLAQMLGGDIAATSEFGVGSTFTLTIKAASVADGPASQELQGSAPGAPPIEAQTRLSGRILLAEDVLANQKLIAFLLQKWGAEVQVVENGLLAVDAALQAREEGKPFDLILMDIQMPEMDGYTATAILRQQDYTNPIIALTAHASHEDRDRCLESGFDGFAAKPIQKDQLFATCRLHMEKGEAVSRDSSAQQNATAADSESTPG